MHNGCHAKSVAGGTYACAIQQANTASALDATIDVDVMSAPARASSSPGTSASLMVRVVRLARARDEKWGATVR
jgi:predicted component of type VI protein secretion system